MSMLTPRGVGAGPLRPRRGPGRRIAVVTIAMMVLAALGVTAWQMQSEAADGVREKATRSCPTPSPTPTVVPAGQVRVNVYNATDRRGLAARVADELKKRGFRVGKIDNDPEQRTVTGKAEVRNSTAGVDAARTVAAQVGDVVSVPDRRPDASVDLVLGAGFTGLLAPGEAAAALSPSPQPVPSGC